MYMDNSSIQKALRFLLISAPVVYPLVFIRGFVYPSTFPRTIFIYLIVTVICGLWFLWMYRSRGVTLRLSWVTTALATYIGVLFISAIAGGHFENSFFSSHERMTGIITVIYLFLWYVIASSTLRSRDWIYLFRGTLFSGVIVALISYLGPGAFNLEAFSFLLADGGSLFGNTTYAGVYYFFVFFIGVLLFIKDFSIKWRTSYIISMLIVLANPDIMKFTIWQGIYGLKEIVESPLVLLGNARASALSIFVGTLIIGIAYAMHRARISMRAKESVGLIIIGLIIIGSIGVVGSVLMERGPGYEFFVGQGDTARLLVWQQGRDAFLEKPILGYGSNNFSYAFQDTFEPTVAFLNNAKWFDKIHNGILEPLVETGVVGAIVALITLGIVLWRGFSHYHHKQELSVMVVLMILVAHLIQIQTSFNTPTTTFMLAILLAYLASKDGVIYTYDLLKGSLTKGLYAFFMVGLIALFAISTIIPVKQNRMVITAMASGSLDRRMEMYKSLESFYGYPPDMIVPVTENYVNALFSSLDQFNTPDARSMLQKEFVAILDMYEAHIDKYGDNFRFLINYANVIHIARVFGVDRMDRAGELLDQAKEISTSYPQIYWLSALQARYEGDVEGALIEIDKAVSMSEEVKGGLPEYIAEDHLGKAIEVSGEIKRFIEQSSGDGVYYHVPEL